jgi:hypothetical protein
MHAFCVGSQVKAHRVSARVVATVLILALAGCAGSPIVRWELPQKAEVPDYSLAYGMTYANRAREAYRDAIRRDAEAAQSLSSGLITLGAAIAGLAAFKAHRDAVVGTGLVGGTALALGNWNLSKQRMLIYQAGVSGINCAIEAVLPLYIGDEDLKSMARAVDSVDGHVDRVTRAIDALSAAIGNPAVAAEKPAAEQLIREAQALVASSRASALSARQFMRATRQAGPALVAAVDRISGAVDKAVLENLPDLSALPQAVSGLAGLAGSFAPGSGVEAHIGAALKRVAAAQSAIEKDGARPAAALIAAPLDNLRKAAAALGAAAATLTAQLAGYDTSANTARLAGCGLTGIDAALKVTQSRVELKPGIESTTLVRVSGGSSAVYSGAFLRQTEGLSVRNPLPGDRTFAIVTTKALSQTGEYPLLISDAAGREVTVTVVVDKAGGSGDGGTSGSGAAGDAKSAATALVTWLNAQSGADVTVDGVKVVFKKAAVSGDGGVDIVVACAPPPKLQETDIVEQFVKDYQERAPQIAAARSHKVRFVLKPEGESCLKTGTAQSALVVGSARAAAALSASDIQGVQRSLCLPEADVAHKVWGPKSRAALKEWRLKSGRQAGSLQQLTPEEFALLADGKQQPQCPK